MFERITGEAIKIAANKTQLPLASQDLMPMHCAVFAHLTRVPRLIYAMR